MIELSEPLHEIIFFLLEVGIILGSLGVVLFTNIVYSAFFLGFVFFCISILYFALNADFVAAAQILIYVGAVNVLIVFAVMLINKPQSRKLFSFWTIGDKITFLVCLSIFCLLVTIILNTSWSSITLITESKKFLNFDFTQNVQRIGYLLLTQFLLPFELLSIVLLVALIGAIVIARRENLMKITEKVQIKKNPKTF
uniref:NAD(P)H-quinone oxidoreductase subunit 6, chloroplastic n=1 Tax=Pseudocrossidium replicatum TaxID=885028 RepID=A0A4P9CXW7_9BRYO|nr:NADH-plastoquinone oxidoreductase subunit 6 [Pseudocrossidium replicatum]QCT81851.1 NADH-plastoquinone oxidoreductase subunit 6 [Pseudocrossidium replicatum]